MHITSRAVPWTSTTLLDPASWCSPSMFCVTTPWLRPASSILAIARWAALGSTSLAKSSRRIAHALARTCGDSTYLSKVKSLGS
jgi:hypothetical protein